MKKFLIGAIASLALVSSASATDVIGSVATKGWFFKDEVEIKAFDDPDYPEIACYVTSVDKFMSWENASDSSIACRKVRPMSKMTAVEYQDRAEVFGQSQSIFFKYQQVDRFYDAKRNVLVYISYVRKVEGENFAHSISVVPVGE